MPDEYSSWVYMSDDEIKKKWPDQYKQMVQERKWADYWEKQRQKDEENGVHRDEYDWTKDPPRVGRPKDDEKYQLWLKLRRKYEEEEGMSTTAACKRIAEEMHYGWKSWRTVRNRTNELIQAERRASAGTPAQR